VDNKICLGESSCKTSVGVGVYEGRKLKFAGRVGTGFDEKLLRTLYSELNKIRVEECPCFNLLAACRSRWHQGLTAAEMKRCHWVKPVDGLPVGGRFKTSQ
jgi:ATP-dependent DNA ligase